MSSEILMDVVGPLPFGNEEDKGWLVFCSFFSRGDDVWTPNLKVKRKFFVFSFLRLCVCKRTPLNIYPAESSTLFLFFL